MYQLAATESYAEEFGRVAAFLPGIDLEQELQMGAYLTLCRAPTQGAWNQEETGNWIRTQCVYRARAPAEPPQLVILRLFYRVDEAARQVILFSIKATAGAPE